MSRPSARRIDVPAARIGRWLAGFGAGHPGSQASGVEDSLRVEAPDGSWAVLRPFLTAGPPPTGVVRRLLSGEPPHEGDQEALQSWVEPPLRILTLLVRRSGYAVAVSQGQAVLAHTTGSRYVQSRTAAGGWSQKRYQRRRDNQADALVGAAAEATERMLAQAACTPHLPDSSAGLTSGEVALVVLGGDKAIAREVFASVCARSGATGGRRLEEVSQRTRFDVGDPSYALVRDVLAWATSVPVEVVDTTR